MFSFSFFSESPGPFRPQSSCRWNPFFLTLARERSDPTPFLDRVHRLLMTRLHRRREVCSFRALKSLPSPPPRCLVPRFGFCIFGAAFMSFRCCFKAFNKVGRRFSPPLLVSIRVLVLGDVAILSACHPQHPPVQFFSMLFVIAFFPSLFFGPPLSVLEHPPSSHPRPLNRWREIFFPLRSYPLSL